MNGVAAIGLPNSSRACDQPSMLTPFGAGTVFSRGAR